MKVIGNITTAFDSKKFKVELTGREVAQIYAGLMSLSGDKFDSMMEHFNYNGKSMEDTSEIPTDSWRDLIVENIK